MTAYSRRQVLGALGAGVVASTGLSRPSSAQETPVVEMGNDYFDPVDLHVEPGTTVRFELAAGAHSATAYEDRIPADAAAFDSGTISEGSFEHTFEAPGTYDYYCIPHRSIGMVGRIVVDSPGGPAEDSPIPDGEVPASDSIVEQGAIADGSNSDDGGNTGGGMMEPGGHGTRGPGGGGMIEPGGNGPMGGRSGGQGGALPFVGGALGMLGLAGVALYWVFGRGDTQSEGDDPALVALRNRYARGEIDEEAFRRRRERLEGSDERRSE